MANPGEASASAASTLNPFEVEQLAAIALALCPHYVVVVAPPYGQLTIEPAAGRRRFHRCHVADGAKRKIYRDSGLSA